MDLKAWKTTPVEKGAQYKLPWRLRCRMRLTLFSAHNKHSFFFFPLRNQTFYEFLHFSSFSSLCDSRWLYTCIKWVGVNFRKSPLLLCTFAMFNWILDMDNSQANDLSLQNLFSILSHNDEIFHGSVSSASRMGFITSVWNYSQLINWFCHEVALNYISFQSLLFFSV